METGAISFRKAIEQDSGSINQLVALYPNDLSQSHIPPYQDFFVAVVGEDRPRLAEIRSLSVRPEYQRRGIGNNLVLLCKGRAKEANVYEVVAITGALRLFEKVGMRTTNGAKYAVFEVL
jgi:N-acetylglutamate synthase-like GNAT family acetyltransferase